MTRTEQAIERLAEATKGFDEQTKLLNAEMLEAATAFKAANQHLVDHLASHADELGKFQEDVEAAQYADQPNDTDLAAALVIENGSTSLSASAKDLSETEETARGTA